MTRRREKRLIGSMTPEEAQRVRDMDKQRRDRNREQFLLQRAEYKKDNPELFAAQRRRYDTKKREQLSDQYVIAKLAKRLKLPHTQVPLRVPPELIDIQRGVMLLKRLLKAYEEENG